MMYLSLTAVVESVPIKTEVMEPFVKWVVDAYAYSPMVGVFFAFVFLDVCMGLCAAFITKTLSSTVSWIGMTKKVAMLLLIAFAAVLEQMGSGGIPVAKMTAGFFCITEALSILENAARCGVPIPQFLVDTLAQLKTKAKESVRPATSSVTIQHASNVQMDVHDGLDTKSEIERQVTVAAGIVTQTAKDVAAELKDTTAKHEHD